MKYFIGCLSSYNNGIISGKWFEWASTMDQLKQQMNEVIAGSPMADAEELQFQDYDGFNAGEYPDYDRIVEIGEALLSYPEAVVNAYLSNDESADLSNIDDCYYGEYKTEEEFAMDLAEQTGFKEPGTWPYNCIDWDRATKDIMYDFWSADLPNGNVAIFNNY